MENIINFNFLKLADNKKEEESGKNASLLQNNSSENKKEKGKFVLSDEVIVSEMSENIENTEEKNVSDIMKNNETDKDEAKIEANNIEYNNELAFSEVDNHQIKDQNNSFINISSTKENKTEVNISFDNRSKKNENHLHSDQKLNFKKTESKKVPINNKKIVNNNKKVINQDIIKTFNNNREHDFRSDIKHTANNSSPTIQNETPKIQNETKVKIKSLFKNYMHYIKKRKFKNHSKLEKNLFLNNFIVQKGDKVDNINVKIKKVDLVETENRNIKNTNDIPTKENNILVERTEVREKSEKGFSTIKENEFNNFDRLKNILDIKSSDVNERLTKIFEKNIQLNNHKFEIQLRPENLGKMQVVLEISGENVDININSDNITTVQSLIENNNNLQKMFQSQGMNLNNFNLNNGKNKDKNNNNAVKSVEKSKKATDVNNNEDFSEEKQIRDNIVYVNA